MALGVGGAAVYLGAQSSSSSRNDGLPRAPYLAIPVVGFALSSAYGLASSSDCRRYLAGPPYERAD